MQLFSTFRISVWNWLPAGKFTLKCERWSRPEGLGPVASRICGANSRQGPNSYKDIYHKTEGEWLQLKLQSSGDHLYE